MKQGKCKQSSVKRTHWSQQTSFSSKRDGSTHGCHHMVNTKIRLITFFAVKDGETLYSQQKQNLDLMAQIITCLLQNSGSN